MLLKLAAAILAEPRVVILNQLYDLVAEEVMIRVIHHLQNDRSSTVIYFGWRQRRACFDCHGGRPDTDRADPAPSRSIWKDWVSRACAATEVRSPYGREIDPSLLALLIV